MPAPSLSALRGKAGRANKQKISAEIILMVGNTGVTKVGVVERGELQRYEVSEERIFRRDRTLKVQSGAGGGELPQE